VGSWSRKRWWPLRWPGAVRCPDLGIYPAGAFGRKPIRSLRIYRRHGLGYPASGLGPLARHQQAVLRKESGHGPG